MKIKMHKLLVFSLVLMSFTLAADHAQVSPAGQKTEIANLANKIRHHNQLYWQGKPEISDTDYDKLVEKLAKLAPGHPLLRHIGSLKLSDRKTVKHHKPMLSLKKVYDDEALFEWMKNVARSEQEEFLVQPKYDGIAVDLSNKVLSTRGNGQSGFDISHLLSYVILQKAPETGRDFRGELIMLKADLDKINGLRKQSRKSSYKTARSAVVAMLRMKEIKTLQPSLVLMDYNKHSCRLTLSQFKTKWPMLKNTISRLPYPMDGMVIKLADKNYAASLGATSHHPRSMLAYKYTIAAKNCRLENVQWQFAAQGLIPVAEFSPVTIANREIRRAALHNAAFVKKHDIQAGDTLAVTLSGDSIPKVSSSKPGSKRQSIIPLHCRECGAKLIYQKPHLKCLNEDCCGVVYGRVRKELRQHNITGIGDKTLYKLVKRGKIKSLVDMKTLTRNDLLALPGVSSSQAAKLHRSLQLWKHKQASGPKKSHP